MAIFASRQEAGQLLSKKISELKLQIVNPIVLGIPRGGLATGYPVAKSLNAPLDAIVLRKLPVPDNPETGFGAVAIDKTAIFNDDLLARLFLTKAEVKHIVDDVYQEVLRRNRVYRANRPFPELAKRAVILTDDGLATGITMLAAIQFAKRKKADKIIVAVPVAHQEAYEKVKKEADTAVALAVSGSGYFAVASFYREFPEMTDEQAVEYLQKNQYETKQPGI